VLAAEHRSVVEVLARLVGELETDRFAAPANNGT
jgi:hypothetical protein